MELTNTSKSNLSEYEGFKSWKWINLNNRKELKISLGRKDDTRPIFLDKVEIELIEFSIEKEINNKGIVNAIFMRMGKLRTKIDQDEKYKNSK